MPHRMSPHFRRAHIIWFLVVALPFAGLLLALSQTTQPEGQCTGIGWGCTVSGPDLAGLAAIFIGTPALLVLLIGHAVIAVVCRRSSD